MNELKDIKDYINAYNTSLISEGELVDFIDGQKSDVYTGTNEDGNTIVVGVQQGVGIEVRTYQNNGWIEIYRYEIGEDDEGNRGIVESETYTK